MHPELIQHINHSLDCQLPETDSMEKLKSLLTNHINELINHQFDLLIQHLYRIDVSEEKIKTLLANNNGENAAGIIATLIIERQLQKINTRRHTKRRDDIPDDEQW